MASLSRFYFWALGAGGVDALPYYLDPSWASSAGDAAEDPATCDRDPHAQGNTLPAFAEKAGEHD